MNVHPHSHTAPMSTTEVAVDETQTTLGRVEAWRLECLIRAGWDMEHAQVIAVSDVDLHLACRMVQQHGCPPKLAFSILA